MSLSRFSNYGRKFLDRFLNAFPVYSSVGVLKPGAAQSKFFSSAFDPLRSLKSDKLTLSPFTPLVFNSRGIKVRGHLQLRCRDCYFERIDGVMHVMCSSYPRHKQRAVLKRKKYYWILTHAFQSKYRPY